MNALVSTGIPGIKTYFFSFGDGKQTHTVSLWQYGDALLYYDGLKNATLMKPNGDTIDFRHA
jgi:endo-beta-N-acetylglucosaminidase D